MEEIVRWEDKETRVLEETFTEGFVFSSRV